MAKGTIYDKLTDEEILKSDDFKNNGWTEDEIHTYKGLGLHYVSSACGTSDMRKEIKKRASSLGDRIKRINNTKLILKSLVPMYIDARSILKFSEYLDEKDILLLKRFMFTCINIKGFKDCLANFD